MSNPLQSTPSWPAISKRRLGMWAKLGTSKGRSQSGQLVVEGVRSVSDALASGVTIESIVARDPDGVSAAKRIDGIGEHTCVKANADEFERIADTVHSSGVAAIVSWKPYRADALESVRPSKVLYCDAITDPGNLGTLIRTAAGLGLDIVVVGEKSVDVTNAKVVRASAGALFRIPIYTEGSPASFVAWCGERGLTLILADAAGRSDVPAGLKRWAAVVGGETSGLSQQWPSEGTRRVRIAMHKGVESLNASVAGAILLDRLGRTETKQRGVESVD